MVYYLSQSILCKEIKILATKNANNLVSLMLKIVFPKLRDF